MTNINWAFIYYVPGIATGLIYKLHFIYIYKLYIYKLYILYIYKLLYIYKFKYVSATGFYIIYIYIHI